MNPGPRSETNPIERFILTSWHPFGHLKDIMMRSVIQALVNMKASDARETSSRERKLQHVHGVDITPRHRFTLLSSLCKFCRHEIELCLDDCIRVIRILNTPALVIVIVFPILLASTREHDGQVDWDFHEYRLGDKLGSGHDSAIRRFEPLLDIELDRESDEFEGFNLVKMSCDFVDSSFADLFEHQPSGDGQHCHPIGQGRDVVIVHSKIEEPKEILNFLSRRLG